MADHGMPFRPDAPAVAEIAAGGVVYERRSGEVLVLHVREEDRWGFPKGHVEPGESVVAAARREITEETGLHDLEFEAELAQVNYRFYAPRRHLNVFKTVVYWSVRTPAREVQLESTFDRFRWGTPVDLLPVLTFDTDRELLERFRTRTDP